MFAVKALQRDSIIVLCQLESLSIKYLYTKSHDIYIISNIELFENYLEKELQKEEYRSITIITMVNDIGALIQAMSFLNAFDDIESRQRNKDKFSEDYVYYLKGIQSENDTNGINLSEQALALPPGQCDQPLPFELVIVLDSDNFNDDHLSPKSVYLQQQFRFTALKHGGSFVCMPNTYQLLADEKMILQFLLQIGIQYTTGTMQIQSNRPEPVAIYKESLGRDNANQIRLLTPKGWDSWNKIQILATSVIHDKEAANYYILANESDFNALNLVFDSYFDSIHSNSDEHTVEDNKNKLYSLLFKNYNKHNEANNTTDNSHVPISLEEVIERIQDEF